MAWDKRERYSLDFEAPVLSRDHLWDWGKNAINHGYSQEPASLLHRGRFVRQVVLVSLW